MSLEHKARQRLSDALAPDVNSEDISEACYRHVLARLGPPSDGA